MNFQGGGITSHKDVEIYIDLIVDDLSSIEIEYPQTVDLFAAFAKYRQGPANFGYAEISKDDRLLNTLSKTHKGEQFFQKIKSNIPLVSVSSNILGDTTNIHNVKLYSLNNIENNPLFIINSIADSISFKNKIEENNFLDGIDKLNKIFGLKPGLFGISINVNEIIDKWLHKKRKENV